MKIQPYMKYLPNSALKNRIILQSHFQVHPIRNCTLSQVKPPLYLLPDRPEHGTPTFSDLSDREFSSEKKAAQTPDRLISITEWPLPTSDDCTRKMIQFTFTAKSKLFLSFLLLPLILALAQLDIL
jgi:hypothetical protein